MWSATRTRRSTSAEGGCRTRRWATADASPTRSIARGACSLSPRSALSENGKEKLRDSCAGDPKGEVAAAHNAKEAVRELYAHADEEVASRWIDELIRDMADETWPVEVRSLGRTLKNWRDAIIAWHRSKATNGPTEGANNLVKRVKRAAFGFKCVQELQGAGAPLCRTAELGPTRQRLPPLKREEPTNEVTH